MKILYLSDKMSQTLSSGISKFTTPAPLCLHTFLHRMNTSGVEIWPILKKTNDIFWTWKANIAKIIIAVDYFCKSLRCRCLTGFPIYLGFWICHGSEYAKVLNTGYPEAKWDTGTKRDNWSFIHNISHR